MTAKSATQRSREFRQRLALKGAASLTVTVDGDTARRLRTIAREHQQSMGAVLRLASVLAQRALAEPSPRSAE